MPRHYETTLPVSTDILLTMPWPGVQWFNHFRLMEKEYDKLIVTDAATSQF
jgi:hypothetical protein